ncbi:MAG: hypothetical protein IRZ00_20320 [Gemmatimonadetes bacterium]|nr:hypothetical protein [Gemmatimonadota bacterium]
MVTRAFLLSHADVSDPIKQPSAFKTPGVYPTTFGVSYDPGRHTIRISLGSLASR